MIQLPQGSHRVPLYFRIAYRDPLYQRHPVLVPAALLAISVLFFITSFFGISLFPILAFSGIPIDSICLLFAFVSGISGVLTSIISLIERFDHSRLPTDMFSQMKEGHSS
jgi:hypothetical protein